MEKERDRESVCVSLCMWRENMKLCEREGWGSSGLQHTGGSQRTTCVFLFHLT